jgi:hypothetical protein
LHNPDCAAAVVDATKDSYGGRHDRVTRGCRLLGSNGQNEAGKQKKRKYTSANAKHLASFIVVG